jgi:hypothetical protein
MAALWITLVNLPPILVVKLRIQVILFYQHFLVNALTIPSLHKMTMDHRR